MRWCDLSLSKLLSHYQRMVSYIYLSLSGTDDGIFDLYTVFLRQDGFSDWEVSLFAVY